MNSKGQDVFCFACPKCHNIINKPTAGAGDHRVSVAQKHVDVPWRERVPWNQLWPLNFAAACEGGTCRRCCCCWQQAWVSCFTTNFLESVLPRQSCLHPVNACGHGYRSEHPKPFGVGIWNLIPVLLWRAPFLPPQWIQARERPNALPSVVKWLLGGIVCPSCHGNCRSSSGRVAVLCLEKICWGGTEAETGLRSVLDSESITTSSHPNRL